MKTRNITLAIIGCGAVTERSHLPAVARSQRVRVACLVDKNLNRAEELAQRFDVPNVAEHYAEVLEGVEAAIIALPHHLHAPVAVDLFGHGLHVLVEKPMALTVAECAGMCQAASEAEKVLAVGLVRRFYPGNRFAKAVLERKLLGNIKRFDVREGAIYAWPVASDFMFRKECAGGGVLIDTGSHTVDMLIWLLGDLDVIEYADDNFGGIEANSLLNVKTRSGAEGVVELSRMRNLHNTIKIFGENGFLEVGCGYPPQVRIELYDNGLVLDGTVLEREGEQPDFLGIMKRQIDDFADAVLYHRAPFVSGEEASKSIALIEQCYRKRRPLKLPWLENSG